MAHAGLCSFCGDVVIYLQPTELTSYDICTCCSYELQVEIFEPYHNTNEIKGKNGKEKAN